MNQSPALPVESFQHRRMPMPERGHGNSSSEIQVTFSALVPYPYPLTALQHQVVSTVGRGHVIGEQLFGLRVTHGKSRTIGQGVQEFKEFKEFRMVNRRASHSETTELLHSGTPELL